MRGECRKLYRIFRATLKTHSLGLGARGEVAAGVRGRTVARRARRGVLVGKRGVVAVVVVVVVHAVVIGVATLAVHAAVAAAAAAAAAATASITALESRLVLSKGLRRRVGG